MERSFHGQDYMERNYVDPERAAFVERLLNAEGVEP